jgi:hypothetical protein
MDYDKDGVFTGCWCPVDVGKAIPALSGREDALGVYYTSGQQCGQRGRTEAKSLADLNVLLLQSAARSTWKTEHTSVAVKPCRLLIQSMAV